jgi:hypothetical protein
MFWTAIMYFTNKFFLQILMLSKNLNDRKKYHFKINYYN